MMRPAQLRVTAGNPRLQCEEFALHVALAEEAKEEEEEGEDRGVGGGGGGEGEKQDDDGGDGDSGSGAGLGAAELAAAGPHPMLVMVYIPEYLMPTEFLEFLSPDLASVAFLRVFRHLDRPTRFCALLQFRDVASAAGVLRNYHGRRFSSFEEDHCVMGVVAELRRAEGKGEAPESIGARDARALPHAYVCAEEDPPNCAVCLERINLGGSDSIVSTLCIHMFHTECFTRCSGTPCPVCRYHPGETAPSACQQCGVVHDVWVCLICGHAGCGRYSNEHARAHFLETLHAYALETHTQQVWDFAGDGYVHRLLYDKSSDKLVEGNDTSGGDDFVRPQEPFQRLSATQEEEAVHSKLEGLAQQHNFLLMGELRRQREFYEAKVQALRQQGKKKRDTKPADVIASLRKQRKRLEARATSQEERVKELEEERNFLRDLNTNVRANEKDWEDQLTKTTKELEALEQAAEAIPMLEEQVGRLMGRLDEYSTSANDEYDAAGGALEEKTDAATPDDSVESAAAEGAGAAPPVTPQKSEQNTFKEFLGDIVKVLKVLQQATNALQAKMPSDDFAYPASGAYSSPDR